MRNINRVLAMTLITSITATSVASTRAWAESDAIKYETRTITVQVPVRTEVRVPVQHYETRYETRMVPKEVTVTDIKRDNADELTCKAAKGMDQEQLEAALSKLRLKHVETFADKPAGSATLGGVGGALLTIVTGGSALVAAGIGAIFGGLFGWLKGGKSEQERDLASRKTDAKYDEEKMLINCVENELLKSKTYAARVPGNAPAGISTSNESKAIAANASAGWASSSSDSIETRPVPSRERRDGSTGRIDGGSVSCSSGCSGQTYEPNPSDELNSGNFNRNEAPVAREVPVEERSTRHNPIAGCLVR